MRDRFDICVEFVLVHETEYDRDGKVIVERDPNDPGGTTKYGIDQRDHPTVDVASLSRPEAEDIYRAGEWTHCRCAEMPEPWDLAVFDTAVNLGNDRAIRMLQNTVGAKCDGKIGPLTLAAVRGSNSVETYLQRREEFYKSLPATKGGKPFRSRFIGGWLNRVADLRKASDINTGVMAA